MYEPFALLKLVNVTCETVCACGPWSPTPHDSPHTIADIRHSMDFNAEIQICSCLHPARVDLGCKPGCASKTAATNRFMEIQSQRLCKWQIWGTQVPSSCRVRDLTEAFSLTWSLVKATHSGLLFGALSPQIWASLASAPLTCPLPLYLLAFWPAEPVIASCGFSVPLIDHCLIFPLAQTQWSQSQRPLGLQAGGLCWVSWESSEFLQSGVNITFPLVDLLMLKTHPPLLLARITSLDLTLSQVACFLLLSGFYRGRDLGRLLGHNSGLVFFKPHVAWAVFILMKWYLTWHKCLEGHFERAPFSKMCLSPG